MGKATIVFLAILLIIALYVAIGSNYLPFFGQSAKETPKKINIGFTSYNISSSSLMYNFEDVAKRVKEIEFDNSSGTSQNTTQDLHIQYISGRNMNETGEAASWMFAIRHGNISSVATFDRYGETVVDWPAGFPGQEISLDQIVPPKELFDRNRALLFSPPEDNITVSRDLTLTGNNYTITITGHGKIRVLEFDAKSGALTSSND
jgi:hypothetical protein